ncbi:hypothetical protein ABZ912_05220 [Nonomuraea angiospora]|uniref:hypothetical protein n=1 Tax=Nonomuraea angiospora TaxID=46172 RepID=UPI00340E5815
MGSEAFYTTAAQVLPTILIALTVEIGLLGRAWRIEARAVFSRLVEQRQGEMISPESPEFRRVLAALTARDRWRLTFAGVGVAFVVGEALSILALGFRWFNAWTFWPVMVCLAAMVVAAALLPFVRHFDDASGPVDSAGE